MNVNQLKEQKNHRLLGQQLEIFMTTEEAPGMPFFLPNGMVIRNELEQFWRKKHAKDYQEIKTPLLMKQTVWEQSGHWAHYQDNMFFAEVDEQRYALKPMSCPGAVIVYNQKRRSYRELPLRYAELGLVHRAELSGSLNGLLRVRAFTQDDAHLFVHPDQIEIEVASVLQLIDEIYQTFGLSYEVELSTRPQAFMGEIEQWQLAERALQNVLESQAIAYEINEGDGAFYGPKIDIHIVDAFNRKWQCGTIQLDFQMPEKFQCQFINEENERQRPILIHRAIFGSLERFIAMLIEHYEGSFPLWLAPEQVRIIPIAKQHHAYAKQVQDQLQSAQFRVDVDDRNEKMGYKIREATTQKIPYLIILGDQELEQQQLTIRKRKEGDLGQLSIHELLNLLKKEREQYM